MNFSKEQIRNELLRRGVDPETGENQASSFSKEDIKAELLRRGIDPDNPVSTEIDSPPEESYLSRFGKQSAKTARNIVGGLGDIADIVYRPAEELTRAAIKSITGKEIGRVGRPEESIDVLTEGYTKPETHSEKISEAVTRGLTGMSGTGGAAALAKGATKAGSKANALLKTLQGSGELNASNIVPTASTAAMTQHLLNNNPDDQLIALLGGLGTGIGSGGLYNTAQGIATKSGRSGLLGKLGEFYEINPIKVEAARESGLPLNAAMVSDSNTIHGAHNILKRVPLGPSKIMRKNEEDILKKIEDITGITQDNHNFLTPDRGGDLAKKGIYAYHKKESGKQAQYQKVIDNAIQNAIEEGNDLIVPTNHLIDFLETQRDTLKTPQRQKAFDTTIQGKALKELKETHRKFGGTPLEDLDALEQEVLDQVTTFGTLGKKSKSQIEYLGKKLSTTVDDFKKDLSPEAKKALIEKNAAWTKYIQEVKDPHFNPILKKFKTTPKEAFDAIFRDKNKEKKLSSLYEVFNETEKKEFTDIFLKHLGTTKDNEFHAYRMASHFKKLPSKAQKTLLSAFKPKMAKKFEKIVEAVAHQGERLKDENTSKTAYTHANIENFKKLGSAAIGIGSALAIGNPMTALSIAAPIAAVRSFAKFSAKRMTSPTLINKVYEGMMVNRKNAAHYVSKIDPKTKYGMIFLRELNQIINNSESMIHNHQKQHKP